MKFSIILKSAMIILLIQFIACTKEKPKEKKKELNVISKSDTIFDAKNIYYSFLKKNYPKSLEGVKLINFKIDDIDLDGNEEAIIVLGQTGQYYYETTTNDVFLLRNENGKVEKIDYEFENVYTTYGVKYIEIQGKKKKFIHFDILKGGSSYGFVLLELTGNKVNEFFLATPLGEGACYLVDKNKDGKYDGYIKQFRFSDTEYYDVEEYYIFKNNTFERSETHVKIGDYPENIQDLLLQYISLRSLHLQESTEVKERLKQICKDQNASAIEWNKDAWSEGCEKYKEEPSNSISINILEDNKTATATYIDDNQKQHQCNFEFVKESNKWKITKVTIIKDGEN